MGFGTHFNAFWMVYDGFGTDLGPYGTKYIERERVLGEFAVMAHPLELRLSGNHPEI